MLGTNWCPVVQALDVRAQDGSPKCADYEPTCTDARAPLRSSSSTVMRLTASAFAASRTDRELHRIHRVGQREVEALINTLCSLKVA